MATTKVGPCRGSEFFVQTALAVTLLLTLLPVSFAAPPLATIDNTEVHALRSRFVEQEFQISVALPMSYARGERTYPVLYFCDANVGFGFATELCRMLAARDDLPELIVVGIGYPSDRLHWQIRRVHDLTPVQDSAGEARVQQTIAKRSGREDAVVSSGGAAEFLQFIREELFPFVEANYRTTPDDRTLIGHSFGGLFAAHVLLTQPESFSRYVIGSPVLSWAEQSIFSTEATWAAGHGDLPARVFMYCGGLETPATIAHVQQMADRLRARHYAHLALTMRVFADETHVAVLAPGFTRGLRVVFERMPPAQKP